MSALLSVRDLRVSFLSQGRYRRVLHGVSLDLQPSEILGVVGESGSGKSVTASAVMGLLRSPVARIDSGTIGFEGYDILTLSRRERRALAGKRISMVFQDALAALNPTFPVGWQIAEVLRIHDDVSSRAARARAIELMQMVGIGDAARRARQLPHEFSGGMRQRVVIAMAVALRPSVILADEPTTALDVTVQAQIVELLKLVRDEAGSAIILITHDLGLIAECADRAVVMYAGQVVEDAPVERLFHAPFHPYTQGLLASRPVLDPGQTELVAIPGMPPDITQLPQGCAFAPRCPLAFERCVRDAPDQEAATGARCHRAGEFAFAEIEK